MGTYIAECEGQIAPADARALTEAGFRLEDPKLKLWSVEVIAFDAVPNVAHRFQLEAADEEDARRKIPAAIGRDLEKLTITAKR